MIHKLSPLILVLAGGVLAGCGHRPPVSVPVLPINPDLRIRLVTAPRVARQLDSVRFLVTLTDARGRVVSGATVTADLLMPDMDMGKNQVTLAPVSPGRYVGSGRFTMAGDWQVTVTARKAGDTATRAFPVEVQ